MISSPMHFIFSHGIVISLPLENILRINIKNNGSFESGEIGLPMTNSKLVLPCGIYGRWEENNA